MLQKFNKMRQALARGPEHICSIKAQSVMKNVSHVGVSEILMTSVPSTERQSIVHINGLFGALFSGKVPLRKALITEWPRNAEHLQCLHCGGQCTAGPPMPAARFYESQIDQYWLYGPFCRPCCSLGYICESDSTSKQLAPTVELLRKYFGSTNMHVAPPRSAHKRFGGPLGDSDFYGTSGYLSVTTLQPPFVTFANYVVAVHQANGTKNPEVDEVMKADCKAETLLPQSAGKLLNLERPERRTEPLATRALTGREPMILEFLANLDSITEITDASQQIEIKQVPKKRKAADSAPNEAPNFLKQYVKKK